MTICEFCYRPAPKDTAKEGWALILQSFVCPGCQVLVERDGGYDFVKGGAYAGVRDPREKKDKRLLSLDAMTLEGLFNLMHWLTLLQDTQGQPLYSCEEAEQLVDDMLKNMGQPGLDFIRDSAKIPLRLSDANITDPRKT